MNHNDKNIKLKSLKANPITWFNKTYIFPNCHLVYQPKVSALSFRICSYFLGDFNFTQYLPLR